MVILYALAGLGKKALNDVVKVAQTSEKDRKCIYVWAQNSLIPHFEISS